MITGKSKATRGYTLVEVLVTITIMGILGAMVIPSLGQTGVLRTHAAVRTVVADLAYAQSDALAYQEGRAVLFDPDANTYTLIAVTGAVLDPVTDALFDNRGPGSRYVVSLDDDRYAGATIANVNFNNGAVLIFDALGGPVAAAGADQLSTGGSVDIVGGDGSTFRINVAAFTGRITVTEQDN